MESANAAATETKVLSNESTLGVGSSSVLNPVTETDDAKNESSSVQAGPSTASSSNVVSVVAATPCPYPMGEHVRIPKAFTYYTDRYFSQYVMKDCKGVKGNNIRLLLHSNMLCVLCLDPSHELVVNRHSMKISSLGHTSQKNFIKNGNQEREVKVQGKKKKNAVICQKEMNLCFIETECGKEYKIPAGVDGSLLEINHNLAKYPSLIQRFPTTEGFIAIINPHAKARFDHMEKVWSATSGELGEGDE